MKIPNFRFLHQYLRMPSVHRRDDAMEDPHGTEAAAFNRAFRRIALPKSRAAVPVVVATVGMIGSAKSLVAKLLAEKLGAAIVNYNDFRVALRVSGLPRTRTRTLVERATLQLLADGHGVVLLGDYVSDEKRASLERRLHVASRPRPLYVHVVCHGHAVFGRIAMMPVDPYYTLVASPWGDRETINRAVKCWEAASEYHRHYDRTTTADGDIVWQARQLPIEFFATVDTTAKDTWKKEALAVAEQVLARTQGRPVVPRISRLAEDLPSFSRRAP